MRTDSVQIANRYRGGDSIRTIATESGLSTSTVRRRLLEANVSLRPAGTQRTRPDSELLHRLHQQGLSQRQIADRFKVSPASVSSWFAHAEIVRTKAPRPSDAELRQLYLGDKLNLRGIADRYAVTKQAVRGWLTRARIETRSKQSAIDAADADTIQRLYVDQQLSCAQIGLHLGIDAQLVARVLHRHGVELRTPRPAVSRPDLQAALAEGLNSPQIATRFKCSVSAVCRALRREQLQTPHQRQRREMLDRANRIRSLAHP